jgi:hypothetical protein
VPGATATSSALLAGATPMDGWGGTASWNIWSPPLAVPMTAPPVLTR